MARLAAGAAALMCLALPVGTGVAHAAEPTVEFSGGSVLNLLVCRSKPSVARLNVATQSRVTFVNRLGQAATLHVDGKPVKAVQANQAVPVVFHYGPVNVSMSFTCGVGVVEEFESVSVAVAAQAAQPGAAGAAGQPVGGSPSTRATGGATPAPRSGTPHPGRPGTSPSADEPSLATEPIDPALLGPDATASPSAPGLAGAGAQDERVFVETPIPASGTPHSGPAGLLALVATVCVVGVGMAAIRAIMAQRASRTSLA